jgi:hypothetical protein
MPMVREEYAEPESFARLLSSIDMAWIEEALEATGAATIRRRRLPAEQVVWLVLGMALYRDWSISRVVSHLHLALPGESGRGVVPSASVQARARLGDEPMRWLFERCAQTWAHQSADRHRYRGLALYGVDGTTVRTLDSAENREQFGGQWSGDRGGSGYPQARIVTLMALRSHLLAAARFAPYAVGETTLAAELWPQVPDDSLCILDRGFLAATCLLEIEDQSRNRHWMTRAKTQTRWRTVKRLGRGDDLVELEFSDRNRGRVPGIPERWLVRAIRYERKGFKPQTLLTSLIDSKRFPARELVALYHERWELELGFDEVKTELLEREEALRSKTPRGVAQELWSLGLLYNLVRLEMEQIATEAGVPPTRISFIAALQFIQNCWIICAAMAPARIPSRLRKLREDLCQFILPPKRTERLYPRAVKIKMSGYPKKRSKPAPLAWKKAYLTTGK